MALTRLGVCGPSAAYPGFVASAPRPDIDVLTRLGVCGPSAAYPGFTSKEAFVTGVGHALLSTNAALAVLRTLSAAATLEHDNLE